MFTLILLIPKAGVSIIMKCINVFISHDVSDFSFKFSPNTIFDVSKRVFTKINILKHEAHNLMLMNVT